MFLMKICMVASGSADDDREVKDESDETLLERIFIVRSERDCD